MVMVIVVFFEVDRVLQAIWQLASCVVEVVLVPKIEGQFLELGDELLHVLAIRKFMRLEVDFTVNWLRNFPSEFTF